MYPTILSGTDSHLFADRNVRDKNNGDAFSQRWTDKCCLHKCVFLCIRIYKLFQPISKNEDFSAIFCFVETRTHYSHASHRYNTAADECEIREHLKKIIQFNSRSCFYVLRKIYKLLTHIVATRKPS